MPKPKHAYTHIGAIISERWGAKIIFIFAFREGTWRK